MRSLLDTEIRRQREGGGEGACESNTGSLYSTNFKVGPNCTPSGTPGILGRKRRQRTPDSAPISPRLLLSPQNRLRNWSSSTSHFAFGFFVHEPLPAPCAQKAIRSSTTATMSPADQNSHTSVQGGAGPSSRRSNPSKIPQKFGGRGRGGGRGKKRDMGRGEWRCVRYNDTF
jgi:hypothetical protein